MYTMTTAIAPVAPEIIPGLPPNTAVTMPIMNAPYSPTSGSIPAIKAKATASGTRANATVKPDKMSFFGLVLKRDNSVFNGIVLKGAKVAFPNQLYPLIITILVRLIHLRCRRIIF